jgi:hypothetical protein
MSSVYIYLLIDPRTGFVRYVGQSTSPQRRLAQHLADESDTPKTRWLREMLQPPQMVIVERSDEEWAHIREQWWIDLGHKLGWQLTNSVGAKKVDRPGVRVRKKAPSKPPTTMHTVSLMLRTGMALSRRLW